MIFLILWGCDVIYIFCWFLLSRPALSEAELSLSLYLNQVESRQDDYKASEQSYRAADLTTKAALLPVSPHLFADANHTDDARPNILFNYDKQISTTYDIGVSEQTTVGLQGRVYYSITDLQYRNLALNGPPVTVTGIQGSPTIELTLPIWRNLLGRETNNQIERDESSSQSRKYNESYNMKSLLLKAESAYWQLSVARETVKVSNDALDRATQLLRYIIGKADSGLADHADVLQARAAVEGRKLDLKSAEDDERTAARAFNSLRGEDASLVHEHLSPFTAERLNQLAVPTRTELRDDTRAALFMKKSNLAETLASVESYKPKLEVFGSYALNNPDPFNTGDAFPNSFNTSRPTETIGLRFNAPLDYGLMRDLRQGLVAQLKSSELSYDRRLFEQEEQWNDLKEKFQQAKDRLSICENLEHAQKEKLDYEKLRHRRGRTTTEQVIQFEADFEQAQFGRIKTMSDILQLLARMKTYGTEYESR